MIQHKGYTGEFTIDLEESVIRGRVVGIRDVVTFQGATVREARTEFEASVDEYLDFCAKQGRVPETPDLSRPARRPVRDEPQWVTAAGPHVEAESELHRE